MLWKLIFIVIFFGEGDIVPDIQVVRKNILNELVVPCGIYDDDRVFFVLEVKNQFICLREQVNGFDILNFIGAFDDPEPQDDFFFRHLVNGPDEHGCDDNDGEKTEENENDVLNNEGNGAESIG